MRCLIRNKQAVWYSTLLGYEMKTDKDGNLTGTRVKTYSPPIESCFNVSSGKGNAEMDMFGTDTPYTRTLATCDMKCPIDINTRLWIGIAPENDTPHNYEVTAIAESLNSKVYALKEVSVSK